MKFQNRQYAGWNASFYPYLDGESDLSVVTSPSLGVYRWDNIYYVGTIADQSDIRSKNTIEDSDLGLDFINMLRPVSYFKNSHKKIGIEDGNGGYLRDEDENIIYDILPGKRRHYGLIAQEVRQVISDLGKTSMDFSGWGQHNPEDPESEQTLSYLAFISPAIKAIQELSAKVTSIEARLQALEGV
jgi:regulator of RNase E activity RraB